MSELTTPVAIEILIDEMCDRLTNYQHEAGECPGEYAVRKWLAQVRREAKIEALREAADAALAVREDHCGAWPWPGSQDWFEVAEEYEATKAAYEQLKESPWGWIMDRADRMEAGE